MMGDYGPACQKFQTLLSASLSPRKIMRVFELVKSFRPVQFAKFTEFDDLRLQNLTSVMPFQ